VKGAIVNRCRRTWR